MTLAAANFTTSGRVRVHKSVWRLTGLLVFCALFVAVFAVPGLPAADRSGNSQVPTMAAQSPPHQSKLQSERAAEMRQRKIDNPEAEDGSNVYRHSHMVHRLARVFGLSVEQTSRLFETVNFVLLVICIVWGVAKILPKALRGRAERIHIEIEQARIATEDANRRLGAVEERLERLDSEIDVIRTQAAQETEIEEKRLRAALEQEKQSILASAAQDIDAATKNARSQLKTLAADLAIEHAKRQIAVTPEADQTLVSGFLTDLDEGRPRGGVN